MLFNSYEYFILLLISVIAFHCLKRNTERLILLVFCSYFFYSNWNIYFLPVLLFSTIIDYIIGQKIHQSNSKDKAKNWLILSIFINISLLVFFKFSQYFWSHFANQELSLNLSIPIGISFYTFQTISYSTDIYRRKINPESNFLNFACYISFFPQILAGPIERASNLLPQLKLLQPNSNLTFIGLKLILFGLFKKVIIGDKLALIIDPIYASPELFSGSIIMFATVLFSFQIYCDFAGYTDIALGSASLFGIKLSPNFGKPYQARSIRTFWQNWHISLTSWFKDYVYIPLGGGRHRWSLTIRNVFIVFILSGIWHGVGFTFLIWGFMHGFFYLIERFLQEKKITILNKSIFLTFTLITFLWIFFRAQSLAEVSIIFSKIGSISLNEIKVSEFNSYLQLIGLGYYAFFLILGFLLLFIVIDCLKIDDLFINKGLQVKPKLLDFLILNLIISALILFGDWGGGQFIYFQF